VGCFVALDGFSQRFLGWEFMRGKHLGIINGSLTAVTGPFKHYNGLAAYLVCISTLFISLFFIKNNCFKFYPYLKSKAIYVFKFSLLFLITGCLFLTFSRGGWIGFLFASLLMLFLSRRWKIILPLFCFFILIIVLVPGIRERALGGASGRFSVWSGGFAMIEEHPLIGMGIGTFASDISAYAGGLKSQYAHNCYLQIWAETGIFALLSFLVFVVLILRRGIKVFRKNNDYIALGIVCAIFGFLAHSFFDAHLYSLQLAMLFWFLAGLVVALFSNLEKEKVY
jgi:O-antigen ligase